MALALLLLAAPAAVAAPVAHIAAAPVEGASPLDVTFDASASTVDAGRSLATVAWDFGDGAAAQGVHVTHLYASAGRFHVRAAIRDDAGASAGAAQDVIAEALRIRLRRTTVAYGAPVRASGIVAPARAGRIVTIRLDGHGVVRARSDARGRFAASFRAVKGGAVDAELASGAATVPVTLVVTPAIRVAAASGLAYVGGLLDLRIAPNRYAGRLTLELSQRGRVLVRASGRPRRGRVLFRFPLASVGRYRVTVAAEGASGLSGTTLRRLLRVSGRELTIGSRGRDVSHLIARLRALAILVPPGRAEFSRELQDSVIAFQKAYGLPRTGVVGDQTWAMLDRARKRTPRYRTRGLHIEVSKSQQIGMMVRDGRVVAIEPVSSGATGNTPEGTWAINNKSPANGTWLGSATLYWAMNFVGNRFALHGFSPVPVYAASHGCVREPIWAAKWFYDRSTVGETVYVYQ